MTQTTCLTKDELNEYLCGWLDEQEMQAVEQHLGNCPNCETTLSGLEQSPVAMFPGLSHRLSDMGEIFLPRGTSAMRHFARFARCNRVPELTMLRLRSCPCWGNTR